MEKVGDYVIHKIASRLPMMSNSEFQSLKDSIDKQGLIHPIITLDKDPIVIDGRNRLKACLELGITPQFITLSAFLNKSLERNDKRDNKGFISPLMKAEQSSNLESIIKEVIIMENVVRRHLTEYQKFLQLKAIKGYPKQGGKNQYTKKNKEEEPMSGSSKIKAPTDLKDITKDLGVGKSTVKKLNKVDNEGSEEIKEKLLRGDVTVNKAYEETKATTPKKTTNPKLNWFEENVKEDDTRYLLQEAIKIKVKIEKELGIIFFNNFIEIFNKVNHLNYKETWKQEQ